MSFIEDVISLFQSVFVSFIRPKIENMKEDFVIYKIDSMVGVMDLIMIVTTFKL